MPADLLNVDDEIVDDRAKTGCGFNRGAIGNETHVALQCSVFKRSEYRFA